MKIIEHNCETDEIIERDMTATELKQVETDAKAKAKELAEIKAKESAKSALLERLGITAEEASLLLQ
jgi:hypothetical protein